MSTMVKQTNDVSDASIRKSLIVKAGVERAFRVFTDDIDSWWPRTHHIGKSPMKRIIIEPKTRGRCYTEQVDGTECDWGTVLAWEPPHRLVFAWQITGNWQFEPDIAKSSEVEVRFTPVSKGTTRIDLEHRYFARQTSGADAMRTAVEAPTGWGGTLTLFAGRAEQAE